MDTNWFFLVVLGLAVAPVVACIVWLVLGTHSQTRKAKVAARFAAAYPEEPRAPAPRQERVRPKRAQPPHPPARPCCDGPCDCWDDTVVVALRMLGMPEPALFTHDRARLLTHEATRPALRWPAASMPVVFKPAARRPVERNPVEHRPVELSPTTPRWTAPPVVAPRPEDLRPPPDPWRDLPLPARRPPGPVSADHGKLLAYTGRHRLAD